MVDESLILELQEETRKTYKVQILYLTGMSKTEAWRLIRGLYPGFSSGTFNTSWSALQVSEGRTPSINEAMNPTGEERVMKWFDAIVEVLQDAGVPMHYEDIAREIIDRGLRPYTSSAAVSVNVTITNSLRSDGERSIFEREDMGVYKLRNHDHPPTGEEEAEYEAIGRRFGYLWMSVGRSIQYELGKGLVDEYEHECEWGNCERPTVQDFLNSLTLQAKNFCIMAGTEEDPNEEWPYYVLTRLLIEGELYIDEGRVYKTDE